MVPGMFYFPCPWWLRALFRIDDVIDRLRGRP